jgi:hypothetical protein
MSKRNVGKRTIAPEPLMAGCGVNWRPLSGNPSSVRRRSQAVRRIGGPRRAAWIYVPLRLDVQPRHASANLRTGPPNISHTTSPPEPLYLAL